MPALAFVFSELEPLPLIASYLLGAIPFGWLFARLLRGVDIRTVGSGGTGATNTSRLLGRPMGLVIFLLDFAKGVVPVLLLRPVGWPGFDAELAASGWAMPTLAGLLACVGHCWPVYIGFRGGKAVATACGAVVALDPLLFLIGGGAWLLAVALFRWVSLGSLLMATAFVAASAARVDGRYDSAVPIGLALLLVLIVARHRANIRRILRGEEPRVGSRRSADQPR